MKATRTYTIADCVVVDGAEGTPDEVERFFRAVNRWNWHEREAEEVARKRVEVPPPGVPDELHLELEELVGELIDSSLPDADRPVPILVNVAELNAVRRVLRTVREAREKGAKEGSRADTDGAISGTDSGAISGGSVPGGYHIYSEGTNSVHCVICGKTADFNRFLSGTPQAGFATLCPGPTPTGSPPGGS